MSQIARSSNRGSFLYVLNLSPLDQFFRGRQEKFQAAIKDVQEKMDAELEASPAIWDDMGLGEFDELKKKRREVS